MIKHNYYPGRVGMVKHKEQNKQPEYFAYFDRCKGQEKMPPVQIGIADSEERKEYFQKYGFTSITEEVFENYKGKDIFVIYPPNKLKL